MPYEGANMARALLYAIATGFGFGFGALTVVQLAGPILPDSVRSNFAFFDAHRDQIDVVTIGSSRVGRHIDPAVFDTYMLEHGNETTTFNFWLRGMRAEEAREIVDEILSSEPRPGLLIVELLPADGAIRDSNYLTDRRLWWRRNDDAVMVLLDTSAHGSRRELGQHARLTLIRWTRAGKGPEIVRRLLPGEPAPQRIENMGHTPLEPRWGSFSDVAFTIESLAELLRRNERSAEMAAPYWRYQRQIREIVGDRADVLFLIPAGSRISGSNFENDPSVISMNDPVKYPSLFDPLKWADAMHLSGEGAREHTRYLAEEVFQRRQQKVLTLAVH